jgi:hypothetical protein
MFRVVPASVLAPLLGGIAYAVWYLCLALRQLQRLLRPLLRLCGGGRASSPYAGKTVLVTTGRQAKTLHGVRALKELGCRVVVTDYQEMSASAVSTACDVAETLAPLDPSKVGYWVEHLEGIIRREKVDLVVPMSTINEALFIGVAKDWLARRLPNVTFLCEGLEMMTRLDNKAQFSDMCNECNVPVPESGIVSSRAELEELIQKLGGDMDMILKRLESTINRDEEIKVVPRGDKAPASVQPSPKDPWQWQRFIRGTEYSAWFVCVEGRITFQGCYRSEGDLLFFDGIPVPDDVEAAISGLVSKHRLTGQYAFDYFREESSGRFFVIECNPRASSVLEGVSGTPGWGASFFGEDVRSATQYQKVGFWFHRNSWPFVTDRSEGFWSIFDPLPVLVAEIAWPLEMLRIKGALKGGDLPRAPKGIPIEAGIPLTAQFPALFEALGLNYHHLDVNIGKVIVPGPTTGREYEVFEGIEQDSRGAFLRGRVQQRGPAPRVLCNDAQVAKALMGISGCEPKLTRLVLEPAEKTRAPLAAESVIQGTPRDTIRSLAQQGKSFDAIILPEALLAELPEALVAEGGCTLSLESLPPPVAAKERGEAEVPEALIAA